MRNRRGVALVLAVLVLTVIGALVAAAFFAATQEQRMGEHTRRAQRAAGAAEVGLSVVMRQWPDAAMSLDLYPADSLAIGESPTPHGTGVFGGYVYRLSPQRYFIVVTGRDAAGRARQRLGLLVQLAAPCDTTLAEGVELSYPKCHITNTFQKMAAVRPLASRAWIQLY